MSTKPMTRKGKTLNVLRDGHPRRMSDGKNAWRKMDDQQRRDFLAWLWGLDPDTVCEGDSLRVTTDVIKGVTR